MSKRYAYLIGEWIELYNDGFSAYEIEQVFNVPKGTVLDYIRDYVEVRRDYRKKYTHLKEEWIQKYKEGHSLGALARMYETTEETIKRYIQDDVDIIKHRPTYRNHKYAHFRDEWVGLYNNGMSTYAIGKKFAIHSSRVWDEIQPFVEIRTTNKSDELAPLWNELYKNGWSITNIAKKYEMSETTVRSKIEGIFPRKRTSETPRKRDAQKEAKWIEEGKMMEQLFQNGWTLTEIAKSFHCSEKTVTERRKFYKEMLINKTTNVV